MTSPDPVELVTQYLRAMERRDFAAASALVAPQAEFVFPGGRRLKDLQGLAANSATRYRSVAKRFDGFDVAPTDRGCIVYAYGTLHGEWRDGEPFSGIRFIDRFEIVDGRIASQRVWNDSGEALLGQQPAREGVKEASAAS